jgi:hypothetical protein
MPTWIPLLAFMALLAAATCLHADAPLVSNGDFDAPGMQIQRAGEVGAWVVSIHGTNDMAVTVVPGEGRNGSACARYTRTTPGSDNCHLDQIVPVQRDTIYQVSAWARADGKLAPVFSVATVQWKQLTVAYPKVGQQWTEVRFQFCSYDNDQVRFEWFAGAQGALYTGAPGVSYLDDVSITPVASPSPELRRAFDLARPHSSDEMDFSAIHPAPVGSPTPLRRIVFRDGALYYEDGTEVALWGVNFQTALSWEWNSRLKNAGIPQDAETLKAITDRNLDELVRMGVTEIRMHLLPSDFTDAEGNLADSLYLDVLDYNLAACRKRGIYVYLTAINEMRTIFLKDSFLAGRDRRDWIADPQLQGKLAHYLKALLTHRNRYSGVTYGADETISVVEIANEPAYVDYQALTSDPQFAPLRAAFDAWCKGRGATEDLQTRYLAFRYEWVKDFLSRMYQAVRDAGCDKPVAWNLNWPRMIGGNEDVFQAAADSPMQVVSFCLYPGQGDVPSPYWNNPRDLSGKNYLPYLADHYKDYSRLRWLLGRRFAAKARAVYEYETFYNQSSYLYPAMAALFRSFGAQMAHMWTYSLSPSAEKQGGSHHLNLYCTPQKSASFTLAGEVFSRTPRFTPYPTGSDDDLVFGDCAVSFAHNLSVLVAPDAIMWSRADNWAWRPMKVGPNLKRLVGCGTSELVTYEGTGEYFVEVGQDALTITINPDATALRPLWDRQHKSPWEQVTALDWSAQHRFALRLTGWEGNLRVLRVDKDKETPVAHEGPGVSFDATPGTYRIVRG